MADDLTDTGRKGCDRIDTGDPYRLRGWSKKFGVTSQRLREIVARVGPMAKDVAKALGQNL